MAITINPGITPQPEEPIQPGAGLAQEDPQIEQPSATDLSLLSQEQPDPNEAFGLGETPWDAQERMETEEETQRTVKRMKKVATAITNPKYWDDKPVRSETTKRLAMNTAWMKVVAGDLEPVTTNPRDPYRIALRKKIAQKMFNGRGAESEEAFYAEIKTHSEKMIGEVELHKQIALSARTAAVMPEGQKSNFKDYVEKLKEHPNYDPSRQAEYLEMFAEEKRMQAETMTPYRKEVDEIWNKAFTGTTKIVEKEKRVGSGRNSTVETVEDVEFGGGKGELDAQLRRMVGELDEEEFMGVLTSLRMRAEGLPDKQKEDFLDSMAKATDRALRDFFRNAGEAVTSASILAAESGMPADFGPMSTRQGFTGEEVKIRREMQEAVEGVREQNALQRNRSHEIRNIFRGDYDPVDDQGFWGNIAVQVPGVTLTSLTMAVPVVGQATMAASMTGSAQESLYLYARNEGMSESNAGFYSGSLAPVVMVPQFALEKVKADVWMRKMPGVENFLTKMGDSIRNKALRKAATFGTITVTEGTIEVGQDVWQSAVQEMASHVNDDMPDFDFLGESWETVKSFPEIAGSMVVLSLLGTMGRSKVETRNRAFKSGTTHEERLMDGWTEEDSRAVSEAKGLTSLNQAVERGLENRDFNSPTAKAAREEHIAKLQELRELEQEAERAGTLFPRFVNEQDGTWTVRDRDSDEVIVQGVTSAEAIKAAQTHSTLLGEQMADTVAKLSDMMEAIESTKQEGKKTVLDPFLAVDENNVNEILEKGRETMQEQAALDGQTTAGRRIYGVSMDEFDNMGRKAVNRIWKGGSVLTVFHEDAHAIYRQAQRSGHMNFERALDALRAIDAAMGVTGDRFIPARQRQAGGTVKLIPDNFDKMTQDQQRKLVDERIAELMEVETLRRRKKGGVRGNLRPGLVTSAIKNQLKEGRSVKELLNLRGFLNVIRNYFGVQLARMYEINKAIREGRLDEAKFDQFVSDLYGFDAEGAQQRTAEFESQRILDPEDTGVPASLQMSPAEFAGPQAASYSEVKTYVETNFGKAFKAIGTPFMVRKFGYTAYFSLGMQGDQVFFNGEDLVGKSFEEIDTIVREEMIHAASYKVLEKRGIDYEQYHKDLYNLMRKEGVVGQFRKVYRSPADAVGIASEYKRAAIQMILYGQVTEQAARSRSFQKILDLLGDIVGFFKEKAKTLPSTSEARAVFDDTVKMIQKAERLKAPTKKDDGSQQDITEQRPDRVSKTDSGAGAETRGLPDQGGVRGSEGWVPPQDSPYPTASAPALQGLPGRVKVDGEWMTFGPYEPARQAAEDYMRQAGLEYNPPKTYAKVDKNRATRIASEFEKMEHAPQDPEVKRAYQAMIDETLAQYEALKRTGIKIEPIPPGKPDPYGNPRNAVLDVVQNNHIWFFTTLAGFGGPASAEVDVSDNPLLAETGEVINGHRMVVNDVFRVVHDYFGHIKEGVGFRADGEENAWRSHSAMYTPLARRAMTTETRGQNSWVNFGPYGEQNQTADGAETEYAPQKIGLLPEWVVTEAAGDVSFAMEPAKKRYKDRQGDEQGEPLTETEIREGVEDEPGTTADIEIDDDKFSDDDYGARFSLATNVPTIKRSELAGRPKFVYFADRTRVGKYTGLDPESGIDIDLQGGPLYPYIDGHEGAPAGWAFTSEGMFTRMAGRVEDTDGGIGLTTLYAKENLRGNPTFLKAYAAEVRHAIKTKKLSKTAFLKEANRLRVALKKSGKWKGDSKWAPNFNTAWRSIDQFEEALASTTFDVRSSMFFGYDPNVKSANKGNKIGADNLIKQGFPNISDMVDLFADPRFDEMPAGTIVGAVEFERGQDKPATAEEIGAESHLSYPVVIKGKGLGMFENPISVLDVMPDDGRSDRNRMRSAETSMASVPSFQIGLDPRIEEAFGPDVEVDQFGFPIPPETIAEGDPLLQPAVDSKGNYLKETATLPADNPLVQEGLLPANRPVKREELGEAIIEHFMRQGKKLPAGTQPVVIATAGGGGAGKSTMLDLLEERGDITQDGAVLVNADDVKALIPEFTQIIERGDGRAAATVHEESSKIAKELLRRLTDPETGRNMNIIFDATLANQEKALKNFDDWKAAGYKVHLVAVTIDPMEAMTRAFLRAKSRGRWVPAEVLAEAHNGFAQSLPEYIDKVDALNVIDNSLYKNPREVLEKSSDRKTISIVNPDLWDSIKLYEVRSRQSQGIQEGVAGESYEGAGRRGQPQVRPPGSEGQGDQEGRDGQVSQPSFSIAPDGAYKKGGSWYHGTDADLSGGRLKRYAGGTSSDMGGIFLVDDSEEGKRYATLYGKRMYRAKINLEEDEVFNLGNEEHRKRVEPIEIEDGVGTDFLRNADSAAQEGSLDWTTVEPDLLEAAGFKAAILFERRAGIFGDKPVRSIAVFDENAIGELEEVDAAEVQGLNQERADAAMREDPSFQIGPAEMAEQVTDAIHRAAKKDPAVQAKLYQNLIERMERLQKMIDETGRAFNFDAFGKPYEVEMPEEQENLLNAIAILDGMIGALPMEVRGKVGGYTNLAKYTTNEQRLNYLKRRLKRVRDVADKHMRDQITDAMNKLVDMAEAKRKGGEKAKGKLGGEGHRYFEKVAIALGMTEEEVDAALAGLDKKIAQTEDMDELLNLSEEYRILMAFGDFKNKKLGEMASALQDASQVYATKRSLWRIKEEARLIETRRLTEVLLNDLGNLKASDVQKAKAKAMKLLPAATEGKWSLMSFQQVLEEAFGEDSEITRRWARAVRNAQRKRTNAIMVANRKWKQAIEMATGKKGRDARRIIWDMRNEQTVQAVIQPMKTETVRVPINTLFDADQQTELGLTKQEIAELEEQFENLPEDARANKKYLTLERVIPGESDNVTYTEAEAVFLSMLWRQEEYKKGMRKHGMGEDFQDDLETGLSDAAKKLRDYLMQEYADGFEPLRMQFESMYGVDLRKTENYSPGRFYSTGAGQEMDVTGSGFIEGGFRNGMLKDRKRHTAEARPMDAFAQYFSHLNQTEHWKAMAEISREIHGVLGRPEVKRALDAKDPNLGQVMNKWLEAIDGNGLNLPGDGKVIEWIGRTQAYLALAWKISTTMKNLFGAAVNAGFKMPTGAFLKGMARMMAGKIEFREVWDSDIIQNRLEGGFAPEVRAAVSRALGERPSVRGDLLVQGMQVIGTADAYGTAFGAAIAYDYHYNRLIKTMTPEQAKAVAMDMVAEMVSQTAQPVEVTDRSLMELNLRGIGKFAFIFASEARQKTALWMNAWLHVFQGKGSVKDLRVLMMAHLVVAPLMQAITSILRDMRDPDDDELFDDENWNPMDFLFTIVAGPLGGMPLIRDIVDGYNGESGPLKRFADSAGAAMKIADSFLEGDLADEDLGWYERQITKVLQGLGPFSAVSSSVFDQVWDLYTGMTGD